MIRAALVVLALTPPLLGGRASAREFFVDNLHTASRDENPGTESRRPLKTVSAGTAKAMPGDTVWVASGAYREEVRLPRSGSGRPGGRIRIAAAPGADVTIKGSDVVTGWAPHGGGIWKRSGWSVNSQQVFVDGKPLQQIGARCPFNDMKWGTEPILPPRGRGLSDLSPGSFFHDQRSATLYVRLAGNSDPALHQIEASVRNHVIASGPVSFIELRGLKFAHSNTSAVPRMMGLVNVEGSGWVVSGCSFTRGDFAGLSVSGKGHRIVGNVCNENGDLGIAINGGQDVVLEGNETSFNNYRGFYAYFQAGGLKAANACARVQISRHKAISNAGPGIWFDLGCRDVTIRQSFLGENTRGIEYETSDAAFITGNVVVRSSTQGIFVNASSDVTVANNTLDDNGSGIVLHGLPRAEHPELRNNTVRNNIIADSRSADLVIYHRPPETSGNSSDHNLFHRRLGGVKISYTSNERYGVTHETLATFAAETGQDRHSGDADPRWAARSSGDYRLLEGSPAIGAGTAIDAARPGPGSGSEQPRSHAGWDVGAFPRERAPSAPARSGR